MGNCFRLLHLQRLHKKNTKKLGNLPIAHHPMGGIV
nr:MAG TPA: hypothetical protein [Ackermannviridae sp. ctjwt21]